MTLPYHQKLDAFMMQEGQEVTDLELAARICDAAARDAPGVMLALRHSSAAFNIRSLPGWEPYRLRRGYGG